MEGVDQLLYPSDLPEQLVRRRRAVRLVVVEKLVAEGRPLFIEGDGVVRRLELVEHLEEHLGEAVDGADDLPRFRDGQRPGLPVVRRPEGVIGPVDDGVAVEQHEQRFFHILIITVRQWV